MMVHFRLGAAPFQHFFGVNSWGTAGGCLARLLKAMADTLCPPDVVSYNSAPWPTGGI